jgi:hypothetical protein
VAKLRIPLEWDPSSNVFIAVAAPTGGVMDYPALVQGDDGSTPDIDTVINFTALDPDDATPASASWTETSPNVYKLNLALHEGEKGTDGNTVLDPGDFTSPLPKQVIVLNDAGTAFVLQTQKVGDWYWPGAINSVASGNATYTLCQVGVGPFNFDWRPRVSGQCIITPTSSDTVVDLLVRLGKTGVSTPESAGNIIGKGFGPVGVNAAGISTVLSGGPPAAAVDAYSKVSSGDTATIYFRAERRAGTGTFTTSASTTTFMVKVEPVP